MLKLDALKTDAVAEKDGHWFTLTCGMKVRIARTGTAAYRDKMQQLLEPHTADIRAKKAIPDEVWNKITIQALAEAVIKDWEPVEYEGKKFEYSSKNAVTLLSDPGLHDIRDEIANIASNAESFRASNLAAAVKN